MHIALHSKCVILLNDELSRKTLVWPTIHILFILHKILKEEFWVEENLFPVIFKINCLGKILSLLLINNYSDITYVIHWHMRFRSHLN